MDGAEECSSTAPLILLPQDQGDDSPACLDGSPYGIYHIHSRSNSTKWTIYLEGGGWCDDEVGCLARANSSLGSSRLFPPTHTCSCMNTVPGGLDPDCNCVYLKYGKSLLCADPVCESRSVIHPSDPVTALVLIQVMARALLATAESRGTYQAPTLRSPSVGSRTLMQGCSGPSIMACHQRPSSWSAGAPRGG